jgi:hypothetical protein
MMYIEDLLYNGFYSFEMITERNLDDVVCGVCGVFPEICLGDGNEKNCCTNRQVKIIIVSCIIQIAGHAVMH